MSFINLVFNIYKLNKKQDYHEQEVTSFQVLRKGIYIHYEFIYDTETSTLQKRSF